VINAASVHERLTGKPYCSAHNNRVSASCSCIGFVVTFSRRFSLSNFLGIVCLFQMGFKSCSLFLIVLKSCCTVLVVSLVGKFSPYRNISLVVQSPSADFQHYGSSSIYISYSTDCYLCCASFLFYRVFLCTHQTVIP
jgi:hypothetical protein